MGKGLREGGLILCSALALYLLLALSSYHPTDPGWSFSGEANGIVNLGGVVGAWIADVLLYLCGYLSYLFPVMIGYSGWLFFRQSGGAISSQGRAHLFSRIGGFVLTLGAGAGLASLHFVARGPLPHDTGGVLGNAVGDGLIQVFSMLGGTLFLLALFLTGITLFTGLSWLALMDSVGDLTLRLLSRSLLFLKHCREQQEAWQKRRQRQQHVVEEKVRNQRRKKPRIEPSMPAVEPSLRVAKEQQVPLFEPPATSSLPPLSVLDAPQTSVKGMSKSALEALSRQVELKLRDFGIEVEVVAVHPGPVITRFELNLAPGVKVNRISNLAKDLARSLSTISLRIVDVIPGKSVVGLEIPNEERELVSLGEILKSNEFDESLSPLTIALGKDISGYPVVVDLARMPHLLVAGTTGSGKSVAINAMVLSLLYKANASDVRLILVDPKMLELSVYQDIPHLLTPVITQMKYAANALRWCVAEMERRYQLMAALGVRNLAGYNRKLKDARSKGTPISDPTSNIETEEEAPLLDPLPHIVVVIDELADLMMTTGKKVEELIARLAQKARAAGIHLILATQRPSVDVITGLIKANIPTRIAFQVSSRIDSRTILDQGGAEQLLGHGDMLYLPPGTSTPTRVHGAFVSDQEVHRVVDNLRGREQPDYVEEVIEGKHASLPEEGENSPNGESAEDDPLYDQAVRIVTETRRASISGVQRHLKVGYNRAARMIEQMERVGIVSAPQGNGNREVLAPPPPKP